MIILIKDLIRNGESKTVEFKVDFPQKNQIVKAVCAFANRAGGFLIIGVNDFGNIVGICESMVDDYLDRISNIIHDNVFPMIIPEVYTYKLDNKTIIVTQVYPGNTPPYYIRSEGKANGTYIRIGKTNKLADDEILQELERIRMNKSFDEEINKEVNDKDISDLINIFINSLGKQITSEKLENLNLVISINNIKYLSNAAEIVLGNLGNCSIKCAKFAGESVIDFIDKKEFTGDIFNQLNSAIAFIKNHINISGYIRGNGLKHRDVFEIPEEVFREAILNAIIHRDYSITGSDIKIAIYDSHIDIVSPGGLPKSITIEEIYAGRSEIRNKIISRIFREANMIEQWGSGIPRIREICRQEGLKAPEISESGMFVKLTIYRKAADIFVRERNSHYIFASSPKTTKIQNEMEQIYNLIKDNNNITVNQIAYIIGLSEASTQRRLDKLQKDKKVKRIGSKKSGNWIII